MDSSMHDKLLDSERKEVGDLTDRVYDESKKIWSVAFPGIVARVTQFGTIIATQSFIGHLTSVDLAAYALVQTITYRFASGILLGMSSATETLCGQAYGARQYEMMGIYLQRSIVVDFLTLTILLPLFIFGEPLFKLLGEEEQIANSAGYISWWFIPVSYSFVFSLAIQMYLQAQQKNDVVAWASIGQLVVHVLLSWLFVIVFDWRVDGAMAAVNISSWLAVFAEFAYISEGGCGEMWGGFSSAAFKDIVPVIRLSISSGIMVCLELWYNSTLVLLAGYMKNDFAYIGLFCSLELWYNSILVLLAGYMKNAEVSISAFSICININGWEFMICLGFLGAACARIATELGRGDAVATKFSIKVLISTSIVLGVTFTILCLAFGNSIGYLFTDDVQVVKAVSDLSLLLAISVLLNSIYPVLSGVAVGAGLQGKVAIINFCCYYIIGIPVGSFLGYVAHLQVEGIWIGMNIGIFTETIALMYMAWKTDWDEQVRIAQDRLQRWQVKSLHDLTEIPEI